MRPKGFTTGPWLCIASVIALLRFLGAPIEARDYLPGPEGWIRHWVVYGPIGTLVVLQEGGVHAEQVHPFTGEPFVLLDMIAEREGKANRQTELNFLPAPGKEIDTAFGTMTPGHVLREEADPRINPNGQLTGVGWVDCDCTVDFYEVLGMADERNIGDYLVYSYTYVDNITGAPLEVFISLSADDDVHVLLGSLPTSRGVDFMKSIYRNIGIFGPGECAEQFGPEPAPRQGGQL